MLLRCLYQKSSIVLRINAKSTNPIPTYPRSVISCPQIRSDIVNVAMMHMFLMMKTMARVAGPV